MKKQYICDCCGTKFNRETLENFNDVSLVYLDNSLLCKDCLTISDIENLENEILMFVDGRKLSNENRTIVVDVEKVKKSENRLFGTRFDVWFNLCGKLWHGVKMGKDYYAPFKCKTVKTCSIIG